LERFRGQEQKENTGRNCKKLVVEGGGPEGREKANTRPEQGDRQRPRQGGGHNGERSPNVERTTQRQSGTSTRESVGARGGRAAQAAANPCENRSSMKAGGGSLGDANDQQQPVGEQDKTEQQEKGEGGGRDCA
jgi:hypothetical protein